MSAGADFAKIELHLVRVLHTVISERSVSRAAMRLGSSQPAVSAQLRRLRALTGDALMVRSRHGMAPTAKALELLGPAGRLLQEAERLFGARALPFDPVRSTLTFRVAASDYLDPQFLPELVLRLQRDAPNVRLDIQPLSAEYDYRASLARGEVDLVIGNWLEPPAELHLGKLLSDEVVCLMAQDHPMARGGGRHFTVEKYLQCEHVAPMPLFAGTAGVIDQHLTALGVRRSVAVRSAHFGQLPAMVAQSLLVLTTGRLFCSRFVGKMPLRVVRCPVEFPPLAYYQLWHDLNHANLAARWLRDQVKAVACALDV